MEQSEEQSDVTGPCIFHYNKGGKLFEVLSVL
jgi:hypothetical protein